MGVLSWEGRVSPKFSASPCGEAVRRIPNVLEVQERARGPLSPCQVRWGSLSLFFLSVLSVFLSVRHVVLNVRVCAQFGVQKQINDFDAVGHGKVCSCAPVFTVTFSDCFQLATRQNAEVQKNAKIWGFSPSEGDTINRSRRNLASKRIPRVCYSTPSLALIRKGSR